MSSSVRHGSSRGQAWFCTTGLPSDVVFEVHDMTFHLHKFPLMSKSRKIHRMLSEQEEQRPARGRRRRRRRQTLSSSDGGGDDGATETEIIEEEAEEEEEDEAEPEQEQEQVRTGEGDGQPYSIAFPDFPGGPGTFEAAAKFCYGVRVDLTAWNVAPLRCAAEYLEMTEDHAEDNLAARAEAYLEQTVLRHPGDATKALKSCEELLPLAEELGIVSRCVEARVQVQHAGVRLARAQRGGVQGVQDGDEPVATVRALQPRPPLRRTVQTWNFSRDRETLDWRNRGNQHRKSG